MRALQPAATYSDQNSWKPIGASLSRWFGLTRYTMDILNAMSDESWITQISLDI
jgi:hypothetical protein